MSLPAWRIALAAAALMALGMGLRTAAGLFVSPLNSATGLGLATLSLLFANGQLAQGIALPFIGAWADRVGAVRVMQWGGLALAAATLLLWVPAWLPRDPAGSTSSLTLVVLALALVATAMANGAVGSNALLVGEVNRRLRPEQAALAVGFIGAGGSVGQMLLGPATQAAIDSSGWTTAMLLSAVLALAAWPLARWLGQAAPRGDGLAPAHGAAAPTSSPSRSSATSPTTTAMLRDPRFWPVAASFGICGFHVSFLAVHMPGVIERCGLPASWAGPWIALAGAANIAGSLAIGHAMRRHDHARLLAAMYLTRALGIAAFVLAEPSVPVLLAFAAVMGASHMATLPPTAQLLARHHGVARLASLMGIVMLVHQVGGFAGIWLGGWAAETTGNDRALWLTDIALALAAAALVWPLRAGRRRPALKAGATGPASAPCAAPPHPGVSQA